MKSLLVTVTGIFLGLVASLLNIHWLAILSTIIALIGAYAQYKDALPYEFIFDASSWKKTDEEYMLVIPKKQHKKESPVSTVFECHNQICQEVICDRCTDKSDAVIVNVNRPFEGKVVIN
jgi:hypothetical protein